MVIKVTVFILKLLRLNKIIKIKQLNEEANDDNK